MDTSHIDGTERAIDYSLEDNPNGAGHKTSRRRGRPE
jgi:hypothetical protein